MRVWIADIVTCLVFYIIYHHFYFKHCEQQWLKKMCESCIHKVSAEDIEQIREDAIKEMVEFFDNKAICINNDCIHMDDEYNCVRCIADQLKEHNNE